MDRRSTLATIIGKSTVVAPPPSSGLSPYSGIWDAAIAAHLLRRTTFGPTNQQIKDAVSLGLDGTMDKLFEEVSLPEPPVNSYYDDDPFVPVGETWVDAPYTRGETAQQIVRYRRFSLSGWAIGNILLEGISIREKLTLFWHNHFSVGGVDDPKYVYNYIDLLRKFAWGNFKSLIKEITINPAMLVFLNGNQNTNVAPNENFARELLELYTIGKGPLAGPGDYTNYTEEDVVAISKVLTGWRDVGRYAFTEDVEIGNAYITRRHDKGVKVLSNRFDGVEIPNMENEEYAFLIDLIFEQREVARFICRKLYRWFVYYDIDDQVEMNVIEPMAQILIDNNFEIKPALIALLKSEHFFDMLSVGPMIKNPLDFSLGMMKQFNVVIPDRMRSYYTIWVSLYQLAGQMDMEYFVPPSVSGWKAYYQEPLYYRTWINAATLNTRTEFSNVLSTVGFPFGGQNIKIDVLKEVQAFNDPFDPNELIKEFAEILFPMPLTDSQLTSLKEILIPGLPDYEWTVEYGEYAADPENDQLAVPIELKLRLLLQNMLSMPEYYLS